MRSKHIDRRLQGITQRTDAEKISFTMEWDTGKAWDRRGRWGVDITWWPRGWRNEKEVRSASGYGGSLLASINDMEQEINGILLRDRMGGDG